MLDRRAPRGDEEIVRVVLDFCGEVFVLKADLVGDLVEGLGEPAIVAVDARELTTDEPPGNAARQACGVAAIEEERGDIPEERSRVEAPHEREREADGVLAEVGVELRVENNAVSADV
jgi:hypothetical protein